MAAESIGVIVPPSNPAVEPEMRRLLPADVDFYIARWPRSTAPLQERLIGYREQLPEVAGQLAELPLGVTITACTGCSYRGTVADDAALATATAGVLGSPVVTAAGAVLRVLQRLAVRTISVVSPYPEWLTAQSCAYWEAAGLTVAAVVEIPGTGAIYDLTGSEVSAVIERHLESLPSIGSGHAVLVTGTGAPSLGAIEELAETTSTPILSSNVASAWVALDLLGGSSMAVGSGNRAMTALDARVRRSS